MCLHCIDKPDLMRSTAVPSKIILALVLSLRYLHHTCPLPPFSPKKFCLSLVIIYSPPAEIAPLLSPSYSPMCSLPLLREHSASGLGITAAPCKTEDYFLKKNKKNSSRHHGDEMDMARITFQGIEPRQQLPFLQRKNQTPSLLAK